MTLGWGNTLASGNGVCRKVMKSLIYKNKLHLRAYVSKLLCKNVPTEVQQKLNCLPVHMACVIAHAIG